MLLTLTDLAADVLQTDLPTALRLIRDGDVPPPVVIGADLIRWPAETIACWAADGCPRGKPLDQVTFGGIRVAEIRERAAKKIAADDAERRRENNRCPGRRGGPEWATT